MATLNFLKGAYHGKLGATVGAKWKATETVRSYSIPSDPHTPAQEKQRQGFGTVSAAFALFAPLIKSLNALDTKNMSVRNALLHINRGLISQTDYDWTKYLIAKGSLSVPVFGTATIAPANGKITVTWTKAQGTMISTEARVVVVAMSTGSSTAVVGDVLNTAERIELVGIPSGASVDAIWGYLLDFRGSTKVSSNSTSISV